MKLNIFFPTLLLLLAVATGKATAQSREVIFYREDIGLYFKHEKNSKMELVPYRKEWHFLFSVKNDSIALIQDVQNGLAQKINEYKMSYAIDSTSKITIDTSKVGKKYFPTLKLIKVVAH